MKSRKITKPKIKAKKIPKLGWGQTSKNAKTIRRMEKADDLEKESEA